jgi:hypothetical protein
MEAYWGMGTTISSWSAGQLLGVGQPGDRGKGQQEKAEEAARRNLADRIEDNLNRLLAKVEQLLRENEVQVLAVAHALEYYKTLSGGDVTAVIEGQDGTVVDGTIYTNSDFIQKLRDYHQAALQAHRQHSKPQIPLPVPPERVLASVVADPFGLDAYVTATGTDGSTANGNGALTGSYGDAIEEEVDDVIQQGPEDGSYEPPSYGSPDGPSPNGHPNGQP